MRSRCMSLLPRTTLHSDSEQLRYVTCYSVLIFYILLINKCHEVRFLTLTLNIDVLCNYILCKLFHSKDVCVWSDPSLQRCVASHGKDGLKNKAGVCITRPSSSTNMNDVHDSKKWNQCCAIHALSNPFFHQLLCLKK
jgi:hypothetical protein